MNDEKNIDATVEVTEKVKEPVNDKKYSDADVEAMIKPLTKQLSKLAGDMKALKEGGGKPALLTTVNCVPVEALGKRTVLRGKNNTKFDFVTKPGYKYPVCDIPKEMADRIIATDIRDQEAADVRAETINTQRLENAENGDVRLKAQAKFKTKSKAVKPLEVANIIGFRYAIKVK